MFSSLKADLPTQFLQSKTDFKERTEAVSSSLEVDMRNWIKLIADKGALVLLSVLIFSALLGAGQFLYKSGLPFAFVSLLEFAVVFGGLFLVQRYLREVKTLPK